MKQTIFVFFLALSLLAGCSRIDTATEPDATEVIIPTELPEPTAVISEPTETIAVIPEATEAIIPPAVAMAKIDFAPEDYYLHPENYEVYDFGDQEYGCDVIVIPDAKVYNFKFFAIDIEKLYTNGKYVITEILHTCDAISPEKPFVTHIYIAGPGSTHYGVSFLDESGNPYNYAIFESGMDGSFLLEPF